MSIQRAVVFAILAGLNLSTLCRAEVTFLGYALIDGQQTDGSGQTQKLEDGSNADHFDGIGSGIAYTGQGNRYLLLPDRGPNKTPYPGGENLDNTTSYPCRFWAADITLDHSDAGWNVSVKLADTTLLKDESDHNFIGLSSAFQGTDPTKNLRLDPEGIRLAPDGSVYICDEYGPNIYRFDRAGKRIGALPVPAKFKVAKLLSTEKAEIAANAYVPHSGTGGGRVTNKGLEGIAITPDGTRLIASLQAPLIQDGGEHTRYTRFVVYDLRHPETAPKELLYILQPHPTEPGNQTETAISEIVAVNDHQLIVDERDSLKTNHTKHLFVADLNDADDIAGIYSLSDLSKAEIAKIRPITKTEKPLLDMKAAVEPHLPADTAKYLPGIPDKIEGLAFGPDLPDGRHLLLIATDNDFVSPKGVKGFPSFIFAFAVDPQDLPNFQAGQSNVAQRAAAP